MERSSCAIIVAMHTHRRLNNALTILVIMGALYIMLTPYLPALKWYFKDKSAPAPYSGALQQSVAPNSTTKPIPADNRIVIPSALIDQPILEGANLSIVDNGGTWRKDLHTKSPKEEGNTVIVAHRFTYTTPEGSFYNLDKVRVGDLLAIYWESEELLYEVVETKVVPETAVEVEDNTTDRRLTLYTCTPLITAQNRLVVIAMPRGNR